MSNLLLFTHTHYKKIMIFIGVIAIISLVWCGTSNKDRTVNASNHNEKYFKCITIDETDSLWSIAEEYMTEEYPSIEDYIAEVKNINNLSTDKIYSGATLVIPYYDIPQ